MYDGRNRLTRFKSGGTVDAPKHFQKNSTLPPCPKE